MSFYGNQVNWVPMKWDGSEVYINGVNIKNYTLGEKIVLNDGNNSALGNYTIAAGANTTAGSKYYKIIDIDITTETITVELNDEETIPEIIKDSEYCFDISFAFSILGKVSLIEGNVISVNGLKEGIYNEQSTNIGTNTDANIQSFVNYLLAREPEDNAIWFPRFPKIGNKGFIGNCTAIFGLNNNASQEGAFVAGAGNIVGAAFGTAFGAEAFAGYRAFAISGKALGHGSFAHNGKALNTASVAFIGAEVHSKYGSGIGNGIVIHGLGTHAIGENHKDCEIDSTGRVTKIYDASHSFLAGYNNKATNKYNILLGNQLKSNAENQVVVGAFNLDFKSNSNLTDDKARFIVGTGRHGGDLVNGLVVKIGSQVIAGKYNVDIANADARFVVGTGTKDTSTGMITYSNGLVVKTNGQVLGGRTTTSKDKGLTLTTKDYVDSNIKIAKDYTDTKNIETLNYVDTGLNTKLNKQSNYNIFTLDNLNIDNVSSGNVIFGNQEMEQIHQIKESYNNIIGGKAITIDKSIYNIVNGSGIQLGENSNYNIVNGYNTIINGAKHNIVNGGMHNVWGSNNIICGYKNDSTSATNSLIVGQLNSAQIATGSSTNLQVWKIIVGNGTETKNEKGELIPNRQNAFGVTYLGYVYADGTFNTPFADYAEMFEWIDGNPNNEDRVGYFVTLENDKIRMATKNDSYVLGIVSSNPGVLGDSDTFKWHNKYLTDVFGKPLTEEVWVDEKLDENNNVIIEGHYETRRILNPEYNPNEKYIPRTDRKEWSPIGMMGKLVVIDDGTCEVNGYCNVSENGIGTKSDSGWRVMKRLDETHVQILFK